MPRDRNNPFARALGRHSAGSALWDAVQWCNQQPELGPPYHRSMLSRWQDGTVPAREPYVAALARRLDDDGIYQAWLEARGDRPDQDIVNLVTRFAALPPEYQMRAYNQLSTIMADSPRMVRSEFSMRAELDDGEDDDLYRMRVEIDWVGSLPGRAKIVFVTEQQGLAEAYAEENCVFRDVIHLDGRRLGATLADRSRYPQRLSYVDVDDPKARSMAAEASIVSPGHFEFDNTEVARARIKVRTTYPFPRGLGLYPILFNTYQVVGPFSLKLIVRSSRAVDPRSFNFLGSAPEWKPSPWPDEVMVESGRPGAILGVGTGIVFYWTEVRL